MLKGKIRASTNTYLKLKAIGDAAKRLKNSIPTGLNTTASLYFRW